jgi:hypothetical protein
MTRHALLAAVVMAACHSSAPATTSTTTSTVANHVDTPPARKQVTDLALMPVDSEAVIGVNYSQLSHSALWLQFVAPKLTTIPGVEKFKEICGFDPFESLQTLAIGLRDLNGDPTGTIVAHGYSRAKAMSCFDKNLGTAESDGSKITIDGDVIMVADSSGKKIAFTFVDDTTALAVVGPDAANKQIVQQIASGNGHGLDTSAAFSEMYGKIHTKDSVWMLINGNTPVFAKTAAMGMHMKAMFGSVNVTDGLTADFRIRVADPGEASTLTQEAKAALAGNAQIQQFFDKLDIGVESADMTFSVAMSQQKLQTLLATFLGAMGGGLGGTP